MTLTWWRTYLKSNKWPRKSFRNWSIPKKDRERYRFPDGLQVELGIALGAVAESATVTLVSGGEFYLATKLADAIEEEWKKTPALRLYFSLDLLQNAPTVDDLNKLATQRKMSIRTEDREIEWPDHPERYLALVRLFKRNPFVVAAVLSRAKGKCEVCGIKAPFNRPDGEPYLEVHHLHWLAAGGKDTKDNAMAVCPNCHREAHHGDREAWLAKLPDWIREMVSTR